MMNLMYKRPSGLSFWYHGAVFADTSKAEKELGWKSRRSVREMVLDSWRFEKGHK